MLIYATKSLIYYGFTTEDYVVLFKVWSSFYYRLWYEMQNNYPQIFFTQNVQLQYNIVDRMNARLAASLKASPTHNIYNAHIHPLCLSSRVHIQSFSISNSVILGFICQLPSPSLFSVVIIVFLKSFRFFINLDVADYDYELLLGYHKQ